MDIQLVIVLVAFVIALAGFGIVLWSYRQVERDIRELTGKDRSVK